MSMVNKMFDAVIGVIHQAGRLLSRAPNRLTKSGCRACHADLLFSSRVRGDGLCGPCSRAAARPTVERVVRQVLEPVIRQRDEAIAALTREVERYKAMIECQATEIRRLDREREATTKSSGQPGPSMEVEGHPLSEIPPGLYELHDKSGGRHLAAVGVLKDVARWFTRCDDEWSRTDWRDIAGAVAIRFADGWPTRAECLAKSASAVSVNGGHDRSPAGWQTMQPDHDGMKDLYPPSKAVAPVSYAAVSDPGLHPENAERYAETVRRLVRAQVSAGFPTVSWLDSKDPERQHGQSDKEIAKASVGLGTEKCQEIYDRYVNGEPCESPCGLASCGSAGAACRRGVPR